jgi:hypothetical protein
MNMSGKTKGFSFIEILVVLAVLFLLLGTVSQLLSSALRGTLRGQETIDHAGVAAILFRSLENDFRMAIDGPIRVNGDRKEALTVAHEEEITLWIISDSTLKRVQYVLRAVDPTKKEILREVFDADGTNIEKTSRFGSGLIASFSIQKIPVPSNLPIFHAEVAFAGKIQTEEFSRAFSPIGNASSSICNWDFRF